MGECKKYSVLSTEASWRVGADLRARTAVGCYKGFGWRFALLQCDWLQSLALFIIWIKYKFVRYESICSFLESYFKKSLCQASAIFFMIMLLAIARVKFRNTFLRLVFNSAQSIQQIEPTIYSISVSFGTRTWPKEISVLGLCHCCLPRLSDEIIHHVNYDHVELESAHCSGSDLRNLLAQLI